MDTMAAAVERDRTLPSLRVGSRDGIRGIASTHMPCQAVAEAIERFQCLGAMAVRHLVPASEDHDWRAKVA